MIGSELEEVEVISEHVDFEVFFNEETSMVEMTTTTTDPDELEDSDISFDTFITIAFLSDIEPSDFGDIEYRITNDKDVIYIDDEPYAIDWDGRDTLHLTPSSTNPMLTLYRQ